jgi:ureidoglycolate lyase
MNKKVYVSNLNEDNFKEFGIMINIPEAEATIATDFFNYYDGIAKCDTGGSCSFSMITIKNRPPFLDHLERHDRTPEVMIALEGDVIFVVAGIDSSADIPAHEKVEAFTLKQGEGVILKPGVWHWAPFCKDKNAKMLFMYKEGTIQNGDVLSVDTLRDMGFQFEICE